MDLPFSVIFYQKRGSNTIANEVKTFVKNELDLYTKPIDDAVVVTENLYLSVDFQCNDREARFHMDGLDTLPMKYLEEYGEEVYLAPTEGASQILFDNVTNRNKNLDTHMDGYYPFIPGYYRIKIVVNNVFYYSWLKVLPKQISESQWTSMRDDIENTLHGLAQDLVHSHASVGFRSDVPLPLHVLRKVYIIQKNYGKWSQALQSIQQKPRIRIQKHYALIQQGKAKASDVKSVRYRARHPESKDYVYQPSHVRSYDLGENQWLIKILRFITKEINELLDYIDIHKRNTKQEIEKRSRYFTEEHEQIRLKKKVLDQLNIYEKSMKRIRSTCSSSLHAEWMQEVSIKETRSIPYTLQLDYRYRQIYHLYRMLKNDTVSVSFDSKYDYFWKRTDLLYEIWGFIQIIKGLQEASIGFCIQSGWIYNTRESLQSICVPFLDAGTTIIFKRDDITLHLIYDEHLAVKREETDRDHPSFTNGLHTRPDVRIDIFNQVEFIGSIMIDFKYRPIWNIWDNRKIAGRNQNDTMRQLLSYRNNVTSPYLFEHSSPGSWNSYRSVNESWAIYPSNIRNPNVKDPLEDYGIRLVELTPEINQASFHKHLLEAIQNIIDRARH
ncbi:DUF2357 domain-containing protein [Bacillus subtilis]|uniref:DUF2357 domain-containing protein n=2 Tax=Bacillus subtilis TaxID=1423 RepID=A0AC61YWU6_BACIU|nr:DUF2357 domain-containing protein [Bacillus subtilis]MED3629146.1 DUF2357 domain-containing protein [Bacillus subtilis]WEZ01581.1 DUF2357 domain-containing protein [Bacillus subtilis]WEZ03940.1 DUF2357 domain-containing protein [Bacillus subtilis]WGD92431.1 DUF2357 domain-containing protein [Bacillus subtilis]